ncbi:hypothetical protein [Bradyrhizobium phage BDU-MI-1]|nr:hypothetical protein [Bradyrhizobium phage BDU-MI-1]
MRLDQWPLPYVRVKCAQCDREGRLSRKSALDRFGPEREMFVVRSKLTETSCNRENKKLPCMSILPDALLVQAILAEDEADVVDKTKLDEARSWRKELGLA